MGEAGDETAEEQVNKRIRKKKAKKLAEQFRKNMMRPDFWRRAQPYTNGPLWAIVPGRTITTSLYDVEIRKG